MDEHQFASPNKVTQDLPYESLEGFQKTRKLVVLLIRHGIRFPKQIPKGWPLEHEIGLEGDGALTQLGKDQSVELGKRVKEKYGYSNQETFEYELISTQSKRTVETARNFMKGLLGKEHIEFDYDRSQADIPSSTVKLSVIKRGEDHLLKRHRTDEAVRMKKEFLQSDLFKLKEKEAEEFFVKIREITQWHNQCLKRVNTFNSLLYCYDQNGITYEHLGINSSIKQSASELAQWSQQSKYQHLGKYTGEMLKKDIERKIQSMAEPTPKDKLVCYFAHDSTLASFYFAFDLDKTYSETMVTARFCSYFAIECTLYENDDGDRALSDLEKLSLGEQNYPMREMKVEKRIKFVGFDEAEDLEMHTEFIQL